MKANLNNSTMNQTCKTLGILFMAGLFLASCQKQHDAKPSGKDAVTAQLSDASTAACPSGYYQLVVDPTGTSYFFRVSGSPSTGLPVISAVNGSLGDNVIRESGSGTAIRFVSGISVDPASGTVFATTSPASNFPSRLLKFSLADVNSAGHTPLIATCPLVLNISDIEYNQVNGRYYAINRGNVAANNRIVVINPNVAVNVICMGATVPVARQLRGLTFGCNGQGYVMQMSGPNGRIWSFSLTTGATGAPSCNYPGPIAPGAPAGTYPEMGLHFDCACLGKFITGNRDPVAGTPLLTDGLPACLGVASYTPLSGVIKPTVDFARP